MFTPTSEIDPTELDLDEDDVSPIEFPTADLQKGSIISHNHLESHLGVDRTSRRYGLACLGVADFIKKKLAERGLHVVTRIQEAIGLSILTDEEALVYTQYEFERASRRRLAQYNKLKKIDRKNLSAASQTNMDTALTVLGRRIQADRSAKKHDLNFAPVQRATPSRR